MLRVHTSLDPKLEAIGTKVVDCAFQVHTALGPGLLESVYEVCLCHELTKQGIPYRSQVSLPIVYRDVTLDAGLRIDLLVADSIVVELKAVDKLIELHEAQLLTYLKLTERRLGYLINFNVVLIKHGIRRVVL